MVDLVMSINTHENLEFLKHQILNIKHFTSPLKIIIILNCNKFMKNELEQDNFKDPSVVINPETIEKERWHGTLFEGINKNLIYWMRHGTTFRHFLILSGRTILRRQVTLENIAQHYEAKSKAFHKFPQNQKQFLRDYPEYHNNIHNCVDVRDNLHTIGDLANPLNWPWNLTWIRCHTYWFKEMMKDINFGISGIHEALCIPYKVVVKMYIYIATHQEIMIDCYKCPFILEELIPHTLAFHFETDKESYCYLPECVKIERSMGQMMHSKKEFNF